VIDYLIYKTNIIIIMNKNKNKINTDLNNKFFCYVLGIIWSDGHVEKKRNRVLISLVDKDMENIKKIFDNTGKWNYLYVDNSKRNYKNQIRLDISDIDFYNFLIENKFTEKSFTSPDNLIDKIPKSNIKYFIRGVIDGDGCFYYSKKNYTRQLTISSTYSQDWTYLSKIFEQLGCKYEIRKIENRYKSSCIRITNKDILTFGDYLYDDFFGLDRKFNKFKEIKESYLENPYENRKVRSKKIIINGFEYESMIEASKILQINRNTLRRRLENNYYESNYAGLKMC
jgi:hypothetical protein